MLCCVWSGFDCWHFACVCVCVRTRMRAMHGADAIQGCAFEVAEG